MIEVKLEGETSENQIVRTGSAPNVDHSGYLTFSAHAYMGNQGIMLNSAQRHGKLQMRTEIVGHCTMNRTPCTKTSLGQVAKLMLI